MSNMYGPRRIVFHKTGVIAICGKHQGRGGSWHPMGRYATDAFGRTELYMVDSPFRVHGRRLDFIGLANNRIEAKAMILKACQNNPEHCMDKDEYVDGKGKVMVKVIKCCGELGMGCAYEGDIKHMTKHPKYDGYLCPKCTIEINISKRDK